MTEKEEIYWPTDPISFWHEDWKNEYVFFA